MAKKYIGERYAQILDGEWSATKNYERLTLVHYDDKGYLSKIDVPAGTLPTNTDYWMLVYNNIINITQVSWGDISGVPTSFPPAAHTQHWDTITNKPTQFPPSPHTHTIADVNGLPITISDIQQDIQDIKDLQDGGGSGKYHIVDMYTDSFTGTNVPVNNSYTFIKYSNDYKIYDAWFQIDNVDLNTGGNPLYYSTYVVSSKNISLLPEGFQGQPMVNATFTKFDTSGSQCWAVPEFATSTFRSVMPNVRIVTASGTGTGRASGILTISMRGF